MKKYLLFLTLLCFCQFGISQSKEAKADAMIQAFLDTTKVPGLSVSISQKGALVYSKGFGFEDPENQIPVDPAKTKFRIGSVSKTVTAAGLGLLYEQGKVDLDIPIEKYVPQWPQKKHKITLRQLAGHLAGIRHYRGREFYSSIHYPTVNDGLAIFINDSLINTPGTTYRYSSYGWNLISAAMEKALGGGTFLQTSDFLTFMQQQVFDALGMDNTVAEQMKADITRKTKFFEIEDGEVVTATYVDNSYKWAGGGFVGTTEDLCKFGQAHMKAGFLKQSTLDEWMTSQKNSSGYETNYGIGWRIFKRPTNNTFYGHTGGSVGGVTRFLIHKETETVVAMTGNISPLRYNGIEFDLMELFINN